MHEAIAECVGVWRWATLVESLEASTILSARTRFRLAGGLPLHRFPAQLILDQRFERVGKGIRARRRNQQSVRDSSTNSSAPPTRVATTGTRTTCFGIVFESPRIPNSARNVARSEHLFDVASDTKKCHGVPESFLSSLSRQGVSQGSVASITHENASPLTQKAQSAKQRSLILEGTSRPAVQ